MPGLVEGHSHVAEGVQWRFVYCGYFDRTDPDGKLWPGVRSIEERSGAACRSQRQLADAGKPLTGWALDPIYFDNRRMTRHDLDRVSAERPIGIMHASGHIMNVNSRRWNWPVCCAPASIIPAFRSASDGLPTGRDEGSGGDDAARRRHVGLDRGLLASRRARPARVREAVRAQGRDHGRRSRQPAASGGGRDDARVCGEDGFPARIVSLRVAREHQPGRANRPRA